MTDTLSHEFLTVGELAELLRSGEANNGPLVLSLLWLERERARLRAAG